MDFARHQRLLFVHDGRRRRLEVVVSRVLRTMMMSKRFLGDREGKEEKFCLTVAQRSLESEYYLSNGKATM